MGWRCCTFIALLYPVVFNYLYIYVMTTITLEVPDSLGEYQKDTIRFIAAKLYESGKLSLGQAAVMSGLTKRTFAELLNDYGVSYINYSVDDLKEELDGLAGI